MLGLLLRLVAVHESRHLAHLCAYKAGAALAFLVGLYRAAMLVKLRGPRSARRFGSA